MLNATHLRATFVAADSGATVDEFVVVKPAARSAGLGGRGQTQGQAQGQAHGEEARALGVRPLTAADRAHLARMPRAFTMDKSSRLPESFDSRTRWPGCIGPVLDQGTCGSCWAVSAVSSISDRLCIERREVQGKTNASFELLSMLQVVACDKGPFEPGGNKGCQGGQPFAAMDYAEKTGLVPERCFPYLSSEGGPIGTCAEEPCLNFQNTPACPAGLFRPPPKCTDGRCEIAAHIVSRRVSHSVSASFTWDGGHSSAAATGRVSPSRSQRARTSFSSPTRWRGR